MESPTRKLVLALLSTATELEAAAHERLFAVAVEVLRTEHEHLHHLKPLPTGVQEALLFTCRSRIAAESEARDEALTGYSIQPCDSQGRPLPPPNTTEFTEHISQLQALETWLCLP